MRGAFAASIGDESDRAAGTGLMLVSLAAVTTDFATGAVHVHAPNRFEVVLQPQPVE